MQIRECHSRNPWQDRRKQHKSIQQKTGNFSTIIRPTKILIHTLLLSVWGAILYSPMLVTKYGLPTYDRMRHSTRVGKSFQHGNENVISSFLFSDSINERRETTMKLNSEK